MKKNSSVKTYRFHLENKKTGAFYEGFTSTIDELGYNLISTVKATDMEDFTLIVKLNK